MGAEWVRWAVGLSGPPMLGFIVWVVLSIQRQKTELDALKLHVAETYAKNAAMEKVFDELRKLSKAVYEIAGKLQIPIRTD